MIPLDEKRAAKGQYWDRAWSLVQGCTPVSAACDHCWAAQMAHMRSNHPNAKVAAANTGITWLSGSHAGAFNGTVRVNWEALDIPVKVRKPTTWAVWTDLFHRDVPASFIDTAIRRMRRNHDHTFIVLTKRPARMANWDMSGENIIVGVTAENQTEADHRIPLLLQTKATRRMVSVEPMLEPVDLAPWLPTNLGAHVATPRNEAELHMRPRSAEARTEGINWVVCGGETGAQARPMHPDWVMDLRGQCCAAHVPFWFKNWGTKPAVEAYAQPGGMVNASFAANRNGALLDGCVWRETP